MPLVNVQDRRSRVPLRTQLHDVSDNAHDNESSTHGLADLGKLLLVGYESIDHQSNIQTGTVLRQR